VLYANNLLLDQHADPGYLPLKHGVHVDLDNEEKRQELLLPRND
jgi:hypothetical protein